MYFDVRDVVEHVFQSDTWRSQVLGLNDLLNFLVGHVLLSIKKGQLIAGTGQEGGTTGGYNALLLVYIR